MTLHAATLDLKTLRGEPLLSLDDARQLLSAQLPPITGDAPLSTPLHLSLTAAQAQQRGETADQVSGAVARALQSDWPATSELPSSRLMNPEPDRNLRATLTGPHQVAALLLCVTIMRAGERARLETLAAQSGAAPWISQASVIIRTSAQSDLMPVLSTAGAQTDLSLDWTPLPWDVATNTGLMTAWRAEAGRTAGSCPQLSGLPTRLSAADQPPRPDEDPRPLLLRLLTELNAPLPPRGEVRWMDVPLHPFGGLWVDNLGAYSWRDRSGQAALTYDDNADPQRPGDHPADFCAVSSHLRVPDEASLLALGEELGTLLLKLHFTVSMHSALIARRLGISLTRAQDLSGALDGQRYTDEERPVLEWVWERFARIMEVNA